MHRAARCRTLDQPQFHTPNGRGKCQTGNSFAPECVNSSFWARLSVSAAAETLQVGKTLKKFRHNFSIHLKCARTKRKPIYRNQKVFRTKLKRMEILSTTFNWIEIAHFRIANEVLCSIFGIFCWCVQFAVPFSFHLLYNSHTLPSANDAIHSRFILVNPNIQWQCEGKLESILEEICRFQNLRLQSLNKILHTSLRLQFANRYQLLWVRSVWKFGSG